MPTRQIRKKTKQVTANADTTSNRLHTITLRTVGPRMRAACLDCSFDNLFIFNLVGWPAPGAAQAPDLALVTLSAETRRTNGFSLAAAFDGEFSGIASSYTGKGIVRYQW